MEKKTVSISLGTVIRECSKEPNLSLDHSTYFSLKNRENVHEVFKYKKFNDDFASQLDCFNDGTNLIGMIRPSYSEFINKVTRLLNLRLKGKVADDEELTKKLLERVERLKSVTSEYELEIEFPLLCNDLRAGRRYYHDLQRLKKNEGITKEKFADGEHYYYGCAMKKGLHNFVITQAELYTRFITRRKEFQEKLQQTSYNGYIAKNFDLDKFYMVVINEYLVKAEGSKNKEEIEYYINLVDKYLESSRKKDFSIRTDAGLKVDLESIKKRLKNLKRIVSDNNSQVEWILIPEGRDFTRAQREKKEESTTIMNYEEVEKLRQRGERKRAFYESTPYLVKAIGLRKYNGYIAYIYENGEVVLDREYQENAPSTAMGDAIYHLSVSDFETLSKFDKQILMKHPRVGRMNHTNTWEERVSRIIEREATEEEKVESKKLVKRLQDKNESI